MAATRRATHCWRHEWTGIEPSEDRLLQGRLFSYADAQRHRVGTNYVQLPINRSKATVSNNNQAGSMTGARTNSDVNYEPSSTRTVTESPAQLYARAPLSGSTQQAMTDKTDNFSQAGAFYLKRHADVVGQLLERPCAIDQANGVGQTALMFARLFGRSEVADLLEHAGASKNASDAAGRSAEDWAATQTALPPVALNAR